MPAKPAYTFARRRPNYWGYDYWGKRVLKQDYRPLDPTVAERRSQRLKQKELQQAAFYEKWLQDQYTKYKVTGQSKKTGKFLPDRTKAQAYRYGYNKALAQERLKETRMRLAKQQYEKTKLSKIIAAKRAVAKQKLAATRRRNAAQKRMYYSH